MTNTNTMSYEAIQALLHRGVQSLAGVCDYAHSQDKRGFNGGDAEFGHAMANSLPADWSPKATYCVAKMLRKYTKQLMGYGIDISAVPEMEEPEFRRMAPVYTPAGKPTPPPPVYKVSDAGRGYYRVDFPYDAKLVALIKEFPYKQREFCNDTTGKYWLVNFKENTQEAKAFGVIFQRILLDFKFEVPQEIHDKLTELTIEAIAAQNAQLENAKLATQVDAEIEIPNIKGELRPFQRGGVVYGIKNKRTFIADEMGLGKTIQALSIFEKDNVFPALIVCRASLIKNWIREIEKFFPHRKYSTSPFNTGADYTVVSHNDLTKGTADLIKRGFKGFAADECQDFKGFKAKRTKALKEISKKSKPQYRLLLSGTPLTNKPAELIPQLDILGRLEQFGGFYKFAYRYCGAYNDNFGLQMGGATNSIELHEKLKSICYIRRLKSQVLTDLPEKQRDIVEVEISNRKEYDQCAAEVSKAVLNLQKNFGNERVALEAELSEKTLDELIEYIETEWPKIRKKALLELAKSGKAGALRFIKQQFDQHASGIENAQAIMLMNRLMTMAALGKIEAFKEWYEDFEGGKIVVFAKSVKVQQALAEAFPNWIYTRASKWETSQDAVDEFARNPNVPGLICSLMGDNAGINGMQCAQYVVKMDMDYVPATHLQAEDRLHRIGQKGSVNVYYFHGIGTIDGDTWMLLQKKWAIMDAVLDGKKTVSASTSIARELFNLLADDER